MNKSYLSLTSLLVAGFVMSACGGGGGGGTASLPPLTPVDAAKAGTFAAVDNPTSPTVGVFTTIKVNAANTGFDVTGKAVNAQGATWTLVGTMTRNGVLQINGTGVAEVNPPAQIARPAAPANMTISGTMDAAQTIPATVNFSTPVTVTFEKAVTLTNPALVSKFVLAADPGINTAAQMQHAAASLTVKTDGMISGALVHTGVTAIPADPNDPNAAPLPGCRFAKFEGIIKNDGTFIGVAGGDAASGLALNSREPLTYPSAPSGTIVTGTVTADGLIATLNVKARNIAGIVPIPQFAMVKAVNPLAGVLVGTHDNGLGATGPLILGVNEDGTTFGFMMEEFAVGPTDPTPRPHGETTFDGIVGVDGVFAAGTTVPIPPSPPIVLTPGLVMVNDEGLPQLLPATLSGSITAGVATGKWEMAEETAVGSGIYLLETTGAESFTATMIP